MDKTAIPLIGEKIKIKIWNENVDKSLVYALGAVFLWSTVATSFKLSLNYISPFQLLFVSSLFSTFVLFLATIKNGFPEIHAGEIPSYAIRGFLNPFLYYTFLFTAYDKIPAQEALALNYTWGIALAILSAIILKKSLSMKNFSAILISFCGAIIIISGNMKGLKINYGGNTCHSKCHNMGFFLDSEYEG